MDIGSACAHGGRFENMAFDLGVSVARSRFEHFSRAKRGLFLSPAQPAADYSHLANTFLYSLSDCL